LSSCSREWPPRRRAEKDGAACRRLLNACNLAHAGGQAGASFDGIVLAPGAEWETGGITTPLAAA
jgi:hypothetical protein